jgi:hypothetical protein
MYEPLRTTATRPGPVLPNRWCCMIHTSCLHMQSPECLHMHAFHLFAVPGMHAPRHPSLSCMGWGCTCQWAAMMPSCTAERHSPWCREPAHRPPHQVTVSAPPTFKSPLVCYQPLPPPPPPAYASAIRPSPPPPPYQHEIFRHPNASNYSTLRSTSNETFFACGPSMGCNAADRCTPMHHRKRLKTEGSYARGDGGNSPRRAAGAGQTNQR